MDNLWIFYGYGWWLNPTPLKNMSSQLGFLFPTEWKNKSHVPNQQPVFVGLVSDVKILFLDNSLLLVRKGAFLFGKSLAQPNSIPHQSDLYSDIIVRS